MNQPCLKLTAYFGERQRAPTDHVRRPGFLADAMLDLFDTRELATSVITRGIFSFGLRHVLRTDESLSLSEDPPVTIAAVDATTIDRPPFSSVATVCQCCDDGQLHRVSGGKMITVGLLIRVETKPDKAGELEALLIENLKKVEQEEATTVCLAMRLGPTSFGVVTAFPDDAGRQAHLAANTDVLAQAADLLTQPPSIERLEVIAAKLPNR
jgi:quinol monooxygenase YgiN/PII-like signaling protein